MPTDHVLVSVHIAGFLLENLFKFEQKMPQEIKSSEKVEMTNEVKFIPGEDSAWETFHLIWKIYFRTKPSLLENLLEVSGLCYLNESTKCLTVGAEVRKTPTHDAQMIYRNSKEHPSALCDVTYTKLFSFFSEIFIFHVAINFLVLSPTHKSACFRSKFTKKKNRFMNDFPRRWRHQNVLIHIVIPILSEKNSLSSDVHPKEMVEKSIW